jgi:hypothetical protein
MYCPKCAAQNLDDAKFCRACGVNLEIIALALTGSYQPAKSADSSSVEPAKSWQEDRIEAIRKIVRAIGLMGASLVLGTALGLFSNQRDWLMIWMVFGGWMACWGVISLVGGIGSLMESRFMRSQLEEHRTPQFQPSNARQIVTGELITSQLPTPQSVTEHTTRSLTEKDRSSNQVR